MINKKNLLYLLIFLIIYFSIIFFIIFIDSFDIELKKNIVINMFHAFFIIGPFLIPMYIYVCVIPYKFTVKDTHGTLFRIVVLISFITSMFLYKSTIIKIENFIDPNAETKRLTNLKFESLKRKNALEIKKINYQINIYNDIKNKLAQLKKNKSFDDINELNDYINSEKLKLQNQIEIINKLKDYNNLKIKELQKEIFLIDSIFNASNSLNTEISNIVYKNTIFKSEKYFDYIISFFLGILANIIFHQMILWKKQKLIKNN